MPSNNLWECSGRREAGQGVGRRGAWKEDKKELSEVGEHSFSNVTEAEDVKRCRNVMYNDKNEFTELGHQEVSDLSNGIFSRVWKQRPD